jgi:hypothetical protein
VIEDIDVFPVLAQQWLILCDCDFWSGRVSQQATARGSLMTGNSLYKIDIYYILLVVYAPRI